jgi:hypothetical protein
MQLDQRSNVVDNAAEIKTGAAGRATTAGSDITADRETLLAEPGPRKL